MPWPSEGRGRTCATPRDGHAVALVHAVTAPLALELVLPWLAEEDHDAALAYAWQAVAALHVAYDIERHAARRPTTEVHPRPPN